MRAIIIILTIMGIVALLTVPGIGANEEDWVDKGLKLISQQRYDEAINAFSTAIEIIPRDHQAYNFRGVARALKGDFEEAIADYNKALTLRPRYAEAYNNRGFARTQKGDLQRALNDYSRALEINPFFVDAYNNKAWILATAAGKRYRDGAQAIMLAQKAVELNPNVASLDTLAAAYAAVGNFESAIETQKKAIQKLLLADQTSEVPKYMIHLKSYRSKQSLLINYSAAQTAPKAEKLKVSLKTKTKEKPTPALKKEKKTKEPQAKKAVTAVKTKTLPPRSVPLPYTIQVSAFRDLQKSKQVAKNLSTKGDQAFNCPVHISGKGKWHRVYIGNYQTYAEAKIAAAGLKKRNFRYVNIAKKPYAVQVGLADSEKEVQQLKARLQAKGYLAYSLPAGAAQRQTRILVGAYESKNAAAALRDQLKKDGFNPKINLR
jgi:tetratricopeptide (TPR) repeat protein